MSIITIADFTGQRNIAGKSNEGTRENVQSFIDKYEPKFLKKLLGSALANEFIAGITLVNLDDFGLTTASLSFTGADIDVNGEVLIYPTNPSFRRLLSLHINGEQITGAGYNILTGKVNGLGGYIGTTVPLRLSFVTSSAPIGENVIAVPGDILPKWLYILNDTDLKSMLVDYIYYWYIRNEVTFTATVGEVGSKSENAVRVSSIDKQVSAWNEMVEMTREFTLDITVYPDWVNWDGWYWFRTRENSEYDIFYRINSLNL